MSSLSQHRSRQAWEIARRQGFEDYENAQIFESLPRNIQEGIEIGSFEG